MIVTVINQYIDSGRLLTTFITLKQLTASHHLGNSCNIKDYKLYAHSSITDWTQKLHNVTKF